MTSGATCAVVLDDRTWKGNGEQVTFLFVGDTQFEGSAANRLAADPNTVLAPMAPVMAQADITMVNLETSITTRGSPEPKAFMFRAPASVSTALAAAGVDVVTMANNHGRDFGAEGLGDTLAAIKASGFPTVGIGENAAAADAVSSHRPAADRDLRGEPGDRLRTPRVVDRGTGDAALGIVSAYEGTARDRLLALCGRPGRPPNTVVVFLHWAPSCSTCPTGVQKTLAGELHDAGADLIVGSHAHRVQGDGYLDGAFVAYGLGNFVWPRGTSSR